MNIRMIPKKWAMQEGGLLAVIAILCLFLTFASDTIVVQGSAVNNFLRIDNIVPNVLTPVSWMAIMAIGVTCVIISGGIDISVGSIFGCSALSTVAVLQNLPSDASPWVALPLALAVSLGVGGACGMLNGLLIVGLRMHPFIVTLGTMSVLRGIALIAVEAKSLPSLGKALPAAFTSGCISAQMQTGPLAWARLQPVPLLILVFALVAAAVYLTRTPSGRELYAVGGNAEAARFSGLAVGWITARVYMLSGLSAGLAGMISAGYYGSANTATGEGYELAVIAAAVVGGASLSGGSGTALGAVLGALVIKLIENGIDILKSVDLGFVTVVVSKEYSKIIIGFAIIAAVAIDRFSETLKRR
ncbi:MAG: ABC transporter permease [Ignavibacteria bacterium]|nr:ABC transporter permease [Ignavibacteria bacterium]